MTDLDELLALERSYDDLPAGAEARILEGVEAILGDGGGGDDGGDGNDGGPGGGDPSPPATTPPATVPSGAAPWLAKAAYVAAGIALGATGHAVIAPRLADPPSSAATAIASPAATATSSVGANPANVDASADPVLSVNDLPDERSPAPAAKASAARPVASSASSSRAAEERAALDVARAALARGRVDACLEALDRHERTFRNGQLAEEREVLAIQALVSAGRKPEAVARARRFEAKYPNSLFGPAVSQAIAAP